MLTLHDKMKMMRTIREARAAASGPAEFSLMVSTEMANFLTPATAVEFIITEKEWRSKEHLETHESVALHALVTGAIKTAQVETNALAEVNLGAAMDMFTSLERPFPLARLSTITRPRLAAAVYSAAVIRTLEARVEKELGDGYDTWLDHTITRADLSNDPNLTYVSAMIQALGGDADRIKDQVKYN